MKKTALSLFVIASSGAYVWSQAGKLPTDDLIDLGSPANATEQSMLPPVGQPAPADPVAPATRLPRVPQNMRREPAPRSPVDVGTDTAATISAAAPKPAVAASPPQVSKLPPPPPKRNPAPAAASVAQPEARSFSVTPAVYIPIPQPRPADPRAPAHVIRTGMKLAAHGYADGVYTGPAADAYYGIIQLQALVQGGRLTALKILRYPNDRRTSVNINRQALPMLRDEAISAQSADVDIISGATLTSRAFIQSLGGALKKASS
ncbi:MAG: FMN-binding protein [Mesorhizobium sp.]|uniref:FMN-binding protein n=1 Tax=Mesorhizobium sp. TaxID=1871066 RepID=UPI000FE7D6E3|nr:FMN-binding protein [Mesorhizobium sp.]RWM11922.1 MAG: FMN-binding protein [Mesorhizobium sp.]TIO54821.1 MAG: FMN-binding protein [Mesorhizobium sp.]TIO57803.1 MAG: FMN-binding protein [Mesorhizobium sp.]TJV60106.1 MAG: FMN-binding protein [Mesorhizobium sp.]